MTAGETGRGVPVRLLLVEDSENDAMLLLRELRRGGYEPAHERVYTPEAMERALGEAEARGEPYDIVISDYYMPRFTAPDALALLRRLGHDVPFIVVSGKIGEDAAVGIMKAGADDYLTKENMARLCPAIERELKEAGIRRERERAEEALARSEGRFRRLVEQAADAMFVHDLGGRFVDVNRRACESLGYAREELLGMSVADVEVDHAPGSLEHLWAEVSSGEPITLEGRHRRKDGTLFPVEVRVGVFEDGGSPLMLALVRDVTGRKEAEERARETEARYRMLVEQVPAVTYMQEPFGEKRVTYVSPQTESVLGYPADRELLDPDHWLNIMHPDDRERVVAEDERTDETGEPFRAEYRQYARDGQLVWIRDEATLLRDEEGHPLYWQGVQYDITEGKLAEEELRRSEERYRTFIEQSSEGIWRFELEEPMPTGLPEAEQLDHFYRHAYLAECNDAMARMYGFAGASDLVGARVGDLLPRSEPENVEYMRAAVGAGYRMRDGETRETDREGNEKIILNNLTGVVEDGRLVRIWGTQRDVTERRRAEDALREAEERYRTLVEGLPAVTYVRYVGGETLSYASPQLENVLGYGPEEYLADPDLFSRSIHPDDREWVLAEDERTNGTGEPYVVECRRITKSGRVVWVHDEAHLVRDAGGSPLYWQGFLTDITDRKRAEEALRQSEGLYRSVVEQAVEGIFLLDVDSMRILEANAALGATLGYSSDELKGMSFYDLSGHDRESVDRNVGRVMREGRVSLGVRQYRRKDGGLVDEEISISTVPYGGRRVMCVVAHDVTERRRAERALEEIREAERNRIARELHDSILQDIVYALQEIQVLQILDRNGGSPGLGDAADALRRSVEGLRGAIFELRLKETLDDSFVQSLQNLVDLNRRMARGAYEIELVVGEGVPPGLPEGRGRELVRIVQEALTNVRRHSGARRVRVRLQVDGDALRTEVSDDGRGFDPERSVSGVGRHSMRQRALELGGEIELHSSPGGGTRLLCRVPLNRQT